MGLLGYWELGGSRRRGKGKQVAGASPQYLGESVQGEDLRAGWDGRMLVGRLSRSGTGVSVCCIWNCS